MSCVHEHNLLDVHRDQCAYEVFYLGNTTYSAICAVCAANLVLVGYVVVAFQEEGHETTPSLNKGGVEMKKDR